MNICTKSNMFLKEQLNLMSIYSGVSKYFINCLSLKIFGVHLSPPTTFAAKADFSFVKIPLQTSLVVVTIRSNSSCKGFSFKTSTIPLRIYNVQKTVRLKCVIFVMHDSLSSRRLIYQIP